MKGAFNKDILRSITHSWGRFFALAAIVALGAGFYAGLRMTAPDMKLAADIFYDQTLLMDIRVVSSWGLSDADIAALRQVEGVSEVMPAYETDVMALIHNEQYALRIHSLPKVACTGDVSRGVQDFSSDANYLNRPLLTAGRWPSQKGECVISSDIVMQPPVSIGDTLDIVETMPDAEDILASKTYTVVGLVRSSYYATSANLGTTPLGSGRIQQYLYVPIDEFLADMPYTEAFLTVDGAREENSSRSAYDTVVAPVIERVEECARNRESARFYEEQDNARRALEEQKSTYDQERSDALSQLDEAKSALDEAAATLESSEQQLLVGEERYNAASAALVQQREYAAAEFASNEAQIAEMAAELDAVASQLEAASLQLDEAWAQAGITYDQACVSVVSLRAAIGSDEANLILMKNRLEELSPGTPDYDTLKESIVLLEEKIALEQVQCANLEALIGKQDEYNASQDRYQAGVVALTQARSDFSVAQDQALLQFTYAEQQLAASSLQLENGWAELAAGKADYEENLLLYEQKEEEAFAGFASAEQALEEAEQRIDDLEMPSWLIMDRDKNYGVKSFETDANRVDSIASVFPFIFFLVAALVALTTMTRMIEEERALIGTYKALGYTRGRIASKYLIYALLASGGGALVGIVALSQVLPAVIMNAYAIIYFVPTGPLPLDRGLSCLAAGLGVGVTLLATGAAAYATLRERPAALMLPRAPKAGKRILLERIIPLWRRLSFSWKVTCRNIFRYKKRFIMTIVGIAGCTALLLTGLGLSNAINDIIGKQFDEILRYNTTIVLEDSMPSSSQKKLEALLEDAHLVQSATDVLHETIIASSDASFEFSVQVVVPQNPDRINDFVVLRERVGRNLFNLNQDSVIITEKLACLLGVTTGETITLSQQDMAGNATGEVRTIAITGIAENYLYNYLYMGPRAYESLWGEKPAYTSILAIAPNDKTLRTQLSDELRALEGVKTVAYNDETIETYESMLSSVDMIVVVLVVAAAALAFIVLYNLTNINITERQREIATLKVLGFTPREIDAYIYREIILLALIGSLVGLGLGVFMESFVVVTAEIDQVMFGREIHGISFILAFALTMFFTVFVMGAMRFKLARINMVESLKSNE